jgi:hypothetical protein
VKISAKSRRRLEEHLHLRQVVMSSIVACVRRGDEGAEKLAKSRELATGCQGELEMARFFNDALGLGLSFDDWEDWYD